MRRIGPRRLLAGLALVVTLLWAGLLGTQHLAARATVLDRLESSLLDLRLLAFGPRTAPGHVVIAAIDDATIRWAGAFPIPRRLMGAAVEALLAAGASAVAIDALFLDPGPPAEDGALAEALAGRPAAVAAMLRWAPGGGGAGQAPSCERPIPALDRVAALGTVNVAPDISGVVRHMPMLLPCGSALLPALPLRAAMLAAGEEAAFGPDGVTVGGRTTPLDAGRSLALRYYGPEGTIVTHSLAAVVEKRVAAGELRGRVAVIGATAHGTGDRFPTPFDGVLPGVEVMATALANLRTGDALVRTDGVRRTDVAVAVVLATVGVGCLFAEAIGRGLLLGALLLALWVAGVMVGFAHGLWLSMALPLAALAPPAVLAAAGRLTLDRWTERRLRSRQRALAAFQSPSLLERLDRDPGFLREPVEREIATVFIDISGFTGLSERLGPRVARDLLAQWHEIVEAGVSAEGGHAASYMADGAMLVWGLIAPGADDALRAVRAAVALERRTRRWLGEIETQAGPLGIKVGGHLGPAVLSRLGGASHQHITAIGDSVNVASRLMKVAADLGGTIALSAALVAAARRQGLGASDAHIGAAREVGIRGRTHPIAICLVGDPADG